MHSIFTDTRHTLLVARFSHLFSQETAEWQEHFELLYKASRKDERQAKLLLRDVTKFMDRQYHMRIWAHVMEQHFGHVVPVVMSLYGL